MIQKTRFYWNQARSFQTINFFCYFFLIPKLLLLSQFMRTEILSFIQLDQSFQYNGLHQHFHQYLFEIACM